MDLLVFQLPDSFLWSYSTRSFSSKGRQKIAFHFITVYMDLIISHKSYNLENQFVNISFALT